MLVLTAITFLTLDLRGFGPLTSLQEGARDVLSPVRSRADSIFRPLTDRFQQFNGGDKLRRDNEALRTELDQLKGQQLRDEADAANYRKLREQVGLQDDLAIPAVIGRVTYDLPGNFAPNTVEIDRGSTSGLEKNQPVITKSGLVGRIERVDRETATVRPCGWSVIPTRMSRSTSESNTRCSHAAPVGLRRSTPSRASTPSAFLVTTGWRARWSPPPAA
ncbi:MAG: rod shape-determining protein MreC, partial [Actinobacteria bacterium]